MKNFLLIATTAVFFVSCSNSSNTGKTFCDTTCVQDSIRFRGDAGQALAISINNCKPDAIVWENRSAKRIIDFGEYLNKDVKINSSYANCFFQDSSAWLSFNDCINGRGYLLKLPYSKTAPIRTIRSALNSFDKKFSIDPDLRAYTDGGNIFVFNVKSNAEAQMTFKEAYQIDYEDIHRTIDSINVTKNRIYVKLLKDGQEVPIEKNINL